MTLSVSENKLIKKYFYISLFLIFFGMIYEHFSYSVYSAFMVYAFLFPFIGGCLYLKFRKSLAMARRVKAPSTVSLSFHAAGISFLTVGSIFKGILDIYGTTNRLTNIYWIVGFIFILAGLSQFNKE